jgi:NAD(P)-dependent dehydrogenase (short-subunit alcohol dehydrogenase family)
MRRFENKVIVIAGGGTGIGAGTALRVASEGADVIIGDLSADRATSAAARIREAVAMRSGVPSTSPMSGRSLHSCRPRSRGSTASMECR